MIKHTLIFFMDGFVGGKKGKSNYSKPDVKSENQTNYKAELIIKLQGNKYTVD